MESKKQEAARTIGRLKNKTTNQERLQGWREACGKQHLSGEFALSTKLNGEAYTEEEARMVAEIVRTLTEMIMMRKTVIQNGTTAGFCNGSPYEYEHNEKEI